MVGCSIYEFDALVPDRSGHVAGPGLRPVPDDVYAWLEDECLRIGESGGGAWLQWSRRAGRRAVQVTSFAGVIQAPSGYQIEVLPKVGKALEGGEGQARGLLLDMLCCLDEFRHVQTTRARLLAERMPLLEVFIGEFFRSVAELVRQGLSSDYRAEEGNRPTLRGRMLIAPHVRENLVRPDRFYTVRDEFSPNRPENRLIRSALRVALATTAYQEHQQFGRELEFAFAEVAPSADPARDFAQVRIDRSMGRYRTALDWCSLILSGLSPLTGRGKHAATSLLFPMESLFEGLVAEHLPRQLVLGMHLRRQVKSLHLVRHRQAEWFQLRPDLAIEAHGRTLLLLDTKWKLLDQEKANAKDKYQLSQADFYQLFAYGRTYLEGQGDLVLIYPRTDRFEAPLHVFEFPGDRDLRLWVLPFCLKTKALLLPEGAALAGFSQNLCRPTAAVGGSEPRVV